MAKTDIEKALAIFHGISAGDVDLATQYIDHKRFVQHNPYATDGTARGQLPGPVRGVGYEYRTCV